MALQTGTAQATNATIKRSTAAKRNVAGSHAVIPNNNPDKVLATATAIAVPTPTPQTASHIPRKATNIRAIEVLIDQDVVRQGLGGRAPWKFLIWGMPIARMISSTGVRIAWRARNALSMCQSNLRERKCWKKNNLLRLKQEIPLSGPKLAALEEGIAAYEKLLSRFLDVSAPDGKTPRRFAA